MNTIRLSNDREVNTVCMLRTCLDLRQKNHTFHNDVVLSRDSPDDKMTTGAKNNPSMAVRIIIIIIIIINCKCVVTRWQWLFYLHTKCEIVF